MAEAQLPQRKCRARGHRADPMATVHAQVRPLGQKGLVSGGGWARKGRNGHSWYLGAGPLAKEGVPCHLHWGGEATKGSSGEASALLPKKKKETRREMTAIKLTRLGWSN